MDDHASETMLEFLPSLKPLFNRGVGGPTPGRRMAAAASGRPRPVRPGRLASRPTFNLGLDFSGHNFHFKLKYIKDIR